MYIEDEIVKLYFTAVSPAMILDNQINYKEFPEWEFKELLFCYLKEYSETECGLLYQNLRSHSFGVQKDKGDFLNVFQALENVAVQMLTIRENDIRCKYTELQRWRELTRCLGEELPICLFLVNQSRITGKEWNFFQWNMILKHSNAQLNAIIRQGISENHFHLYGSAPTFELIWLKLMNTITLTNTYAKELYAIDKKRRNHNYFWDNEYKETSIKCMILQAALIRAVLFWYINLDKQTCGVGEQYRKQIEPLIEYLKKGERIADIQKEIRELINLLKADAMLRYDENIPDYAILQPSSNNLNWIFTGERELVYRVLDRILIKQEKMDELAKLFYAYLAIRCTIRKELVQCNQNIGFENFSMYQKRKNGFLTWKKDLEQMIKYAVKGSFEAGNLKSLEIRVTPTDNYLDNVRQILFMDNLIEVQGNIQKTKFYYVYHFCKRQDRRKVKDGDYEIVCRDADLRKQIRKVGKEIIVLRERMPVEASRIRGIDACSQEIGCRPEVFAPTFRRLTSHVVSLDSDNVVKQLKQTYHAGEDFLDIADGLRAMDEAVHFLNMKNGDRFGHATVLGIDIEKWYQRKHYMIFIPKQDYLDNIVWMYQKILEFHLGDCEQLKSFLLREYEEYFAQIYGGCFERQNSISIHMYYEAWKLRGDDPEWYVERQKQEERSVTCKCRTYAKNERFLGDYAINREFPENLQIRDKREIVGLYQKYHYCPNARENGKISVKIYISKIYIDGIKKIQKEMQRMIAAKGIGIETNPSSNVLISSINGYEEHPIINLYNIGLKCKENEDCAQLFVSINTDDKGVFNTSLENEYALMASALENMQDVDGKKYFNKQEVYEWINRIRIMGNQQVFTVGDTIEGEG